MRIKYEFLIVKGDTSAKFLVREDMYDDNGKLQSKGDFKKVRVVTEEVFKQIHPQRELKTL